MTRLPRVSLRIDRPAQRAAAVLSVGLGLALSLGSAVAQTKGSPEHIKAVTSAVDGASIRTNTAMSNDWPTIGLDYAETRFSKLHDINADNVKKLGLVWTYPLESSRGVEATPVVVDGIMYQTASWSVVHAIDARTGKKIWNRASFLPSGQARSGNSQRAAPARRSIGRGKTGSAARSARSARNGLSSIQFCIMNCVLRRGSGTPS
jgi:glucose dehydrogenase